MVLVNGIRDSGGCFKIVREEYGGEHITWGTPIEVGKELP